MTHSDAQLVIVNDFNVYRTFSGLLEAHSKLVIDPNAVLACTISHKSLQSVSWQDSEILKRGCSIEHREFAHCNSLNVDEALNPITIEIEKTLCVSTCIRI